MRKTRIAIPKDPQPTTGGTPEEAPHGTVYVLSLDKARETIELHVRDEKPLVFTRNLTVENMVTASTAQTWHLIYPPPTIDSNDFLILERTLQGEWPKSGPIRSTRRTGTNLRT